MWNIELNIAGFRFSSEIPYVRRRQLWFSPRLAHWSLPQHRHEPAA